MRGRGHDGGLSAAGEEGEAYVEEEAGGKVGMATGACSLENSPINLIAVREECARVLVSALDSLEGPKILVLDPELIGPLGTIATVAVLKEHGVAGIFPLDADLFRKKGAADAQCCVFIARPSLESTRVFADHMKAHGDKLFSLFFVPRRSANCERMLMEEGLIEQLAQPIAEMKLDLVPYDNDVLSLELRGSFRNLFIDHDHTELYYVAEAMMRLQEQFGTIPIIRTKGLCAKKVKDIMVRLRREKGPGGGAAAAAGGEIDSLIILDRDVDLVTPMLTQNTFEGLVDEHFGITCSAVQIPSEMAGDEKNAGKPKKWPLNSDNTVYADIRDKNFGVVLQVLGQKTRDLKEAEDERHNAHSVGQIKDFVKKLGSLQSEKASLQTFVNIAIAIKDECGDDFGEHFSTEQDLIRGDEVRACIEYLDQAIIDKKPLVSVLRQLCLLSLTTNELKQKKFDEIRTSILQSYGYPALFTLLNLEKVGLLQRYGAPATPVGQMGPRPGNWGRARSQCHLFPDGGDEQERPTDIAYTYAGYAPLSCRLVQMAHGDGPYKAKPQAWGALDADLPGGPSDEVVQISGASAGSGGGGGEGGRKKKLTLVLFLGGVTYAEISALRFMGEHDPNRQYMVATTKISNGATMLETMVEQTDGLTMDRSSWGREPRRYG